MGGKITRRGLLGAGAGATFVPLTGCKAGDLRNPDRSDTVNQLRGQVTDPWGDPVETLVRIYDSEEDATTVVAETVSDGDGIFRISSARLPERYFLTVHERDGGFFGFATPGTMNTDEPVQITLYSELLTTRPIAARFDERGSRQGVLTIWRLIHEADHREQVLYFELTETPYGWGENEHEIDVPPNRADPNAHRYDEYVLNNPITAGAFSLIVPEAGVTVKYDPTAEIFGDSQITVWKALDKAAVPADRMRRIQDFHPVLTDIPGFLGASSDFDPLTSQDETRAEALEEGLVVLSGMTIAGLASVVGGGVAATGVGLLGDFGPLLANYFGIDVDLGLDTEPLRLASSGPPPQFSPNDFDVIGTSWAMDASSVVFGVPVRIESDDPVSVLVDVEWITRTLRKRVQYSKEFDLTVRRRTRTERSEGSTGPLSIQLLRPGDMTTYTRQHKSQQMELYFNRDPDLTSGEKYRFEITDAGRDGTLRVEATTDMDSIEACPDPGQGGCDGLKLLIHRPDGRIQDPKLWGSGDPVPANFQLSGDITTAGIAERSVALIDKRSDEPIAEAGPMMYVIGYSGILTQDSTSGSVRVSFPRDLLPRDARVEAVIYDASSDANSTEEVDAVSDKVRVDLSLDPAADVFSGSFRARDLAGGTYAWRVAVTHPSGIQFDRWFPPGSPEDVLLVVGE